MYVNIILYIYIYIYIYILIFYSDRQIDWFGAKEYFQKIFLMKSFISFCNQSPLFVFCAGNSGLKLDHES